MNKPKRKDISGFLIALGIIILVNFISSYSFFRWDLTSDHRYSITEPTKKLLRSLDDQLYIKVYLQGDDLPSSMIRLRNECRELLGEFRAYAGDNISFEFINPSSNTSEKERDQVYKNLYDKGLRPTDLEIKDESGVARRMVWPGAIMNYKGKEMSVQLLGSQFGAPPQVILNQSIESMEYELASTIKTISSEETKRIAFLEGNGDCIVLPQPNISRTGIDQESCADSEFIHRDFCFGNFHHVDQHLYCDATFLKFENRCVILLEE